MRKVIDQFGRFGPILLLAGLFYYSVTSLWDWRAQVAVFGGAGLIVIFLLFNLPKIRSALKSRSARIGGAALATLILVVGILVLLNFLNYRHHKRVDLSEGQLHALSSQTERVLNNLEQKIDIIGFFTDEAEAAQFLERAREYHYISSNIEYEVVDPQQEPGRVAQYEVTRNGEVVVAGATKREILDDATEENLTNAIIKVTRDEEKVIYFLVGHGERDLQGSDERGFATVQSEIEKQNYRVESYNLAQENRLPEDASALVSAGPEVNFFPNEVELLRTYLEQGGKFLLLVDPESDGSEFKMNDFLASYGVNLENDLIVDASGLGRLFGFGPAAPLAADYASHPITEELEGTMTIFPGAQSLSTVESDFDTIDLVSSSPQSWGETDMGGEEVSFDEASDRQGPLPVAMVATKTIERTDPEETEEAEEPSGIQDIVSGSDDQEAAPREARVVIFGDSDFASNGFFGRSVNGDLFLNAVSWLAEDTDLLSIRPKDPENRSITLTATESNLIFWTTVIFFPLATLIFGTAVWYRRR